MAPAEDDISIEEKRVYAARAGRTDAYVAAEMGVVRVAISGDVIGEFELATREPARDVAVLDRAGEPGTIAVAADGKLLVGRLIGPDGSTGSNDAAEADDATRASDSIDLTAVDGVEPPVAVGVHDGSFLVASRTGSVSHVRVAGGWEGGHAEEAAISTERLGTVAEPRAVDGPLVAGEDGVHRVVDDARGTRIEPVGLQDVRDVAGAGIPLAATPEGLYWLGNGWMDALAGSFDAVAADGDGHAMAAGRGTLFVRTETTDANATGGETVRGWSADAWTEATLPTDGRVAALGYGPGLSIAVTDDGTVCVDAGDGWRHRSVGVPGVTGVALATVDADVAERAAR